ncbi:Fis family transcriptional regulator [Ampullimonas aquatilis]|uniref:Fis family transcriptional regulator n=1 Tax=Ampullimonas aquatilis TaxID=1341549 RepID=UPI003C744C21
MSKQKIEDCIKASLEDYFVDLGEEQPHSIYDMVMQTVERPLLESVMERAHQNQSVAAGLLGINRNTLRKKLQIHGLL